MNREQEQAYLRQAVTGWFNDSDQVEHYTRELEQGLARAEKNLLGELPSDGAVLDIGCGAGRISSYLAERGYRVTGVDSSDALLSVARRMAASRGLPIQLVLSDGIQLPFPDKTFNIIVAFKMFGYIPTKESRHFFLDELYRVMKPGGSCVMTQSIVPDEHLGDAVDEHYASSPAAGFESLEKGDTFPSGKGYVHWFTSASLREELEASRFTIARYEDDAPFGGSGNQQLIRLIRQVNDG